MIKTYYKLTKPGIVYGNALTASAGFFFASHWSVDWLLYISTIVGLSLIIASACVVNNYLDRDIDRLMARTKSRALAAGTLAARRALIYAAVLGTVGTVILALYTNMLATLIALAGCVVYIGIYTFAKRHTVYSTHIGALSGAMPPVVGYTAVTGVFDWTALALFFILCMWQMAHFFSIALYRKDEYAAAGLPIMSVRHGAARTTREIIAYIIAFSIGVFILPHTGLGYKIIAGLACLTWLLFALKGFFMLNATSQVTKWAKHMFFISLFVILALSIALTIN